MTSYNPQRLTGFRQDQLAAAFDRVRDPRDWKAPIRAVIKREQQTVVAEAVRWFTDTDPVFIPAPDASGRLLVSAPGYRQGPAGDR